MPKNGGCSDIGLNGQRISFDFEIRSLNENEHCGLEMEFSPERGQESRRLLLSLLLLAAWKPGSGQVHYSVPEEAKHGTFVGRIAQDLGLELTTRQGTNVRQKGIISESVNKGGFYLGEEKRY